MHALSCYHFESEAITMLHKRGIMHIWKSISWFQNWDMFRYTWDFPINRDHFVIDTTDSPLYLLLWATELYTQKNSIPSHTLQLDSKMVVIVTYNMHNISVSSRVLVLHLHIVLPYFTLPSPKLKRTSVGCVCFLFRWREGVWSCASKHAPQSLQLGLLERQALGKQGAFLTGISFSLMMPGAQKRTMTDEGKEADGCKVDFGDWLWEKVSHETAHANELKILLELHPPKALGHREHTLSSRTTNKKGKQENRAVGNLKFQHPFGRRLANVALTRAQLGLVVVANTQAIGDGPQRGGGCVQSLQSCCWTVFVSATKNPKQQLKATLRPLLDFTKQFLIFAAPVSSRNSLHLSTSSKSRLFLWVPQGLVQRLTLEESLPSCAKEWFLLARGRSWIVIDHDIFFLWTWFPQNMRQKKPNFPGGGGCWVRKVEGAT